MRAAVIPARGGSKRIPRKNVREFAGKPMIAYSIECARRSALFDRVIVSTDDDEISRIARDYGAEVPFRRPVHLADDYASTVDVLGHAVEWLQRDTSETLAVCCIYATAPFLRVEDLVRGLATLQQGNWQYVFSATTFASPVHRSFWRESGGGLQMLFPEHCETRSQDLPEVFHDAAQFYWGKVDAWLARQRIFDRFSTIVDIPRWRVQDIDTEEDWLRAELMMNYLAQVHGSGTDNG